jgi:hypothetical protein
MLKESASLTGERAQALKVAMAELEGRGKVYSSMSSKSMSVVRNYSITRWPAA